VSFCQHPPLHLWAPLCPPPPPPTLYSLHFMHCLLQYIIILKMVEIQIPVSIVNVLEVFIPCMHILLSCYAYN